MQRLSEAELQHLCLAAKPEARIAVSTSYRGTRLVAWGAGNRIINVFRQRRPVETVLSAQSTAGAVTETCTGPALYCSCVLQPPDVTGMQNRPRPLRAHHAVHIAWAELPPSGRIQRPRQFLIVVASDGSVSVFEPVSKGRSMLPLVTFHAEASKPARPVAAVAVLPVESSPPRE